MIHSCLVCVCVCVRWCVRWCVLRWCVLRWCVLRWCVLRWCVLRVGVCCALVCVALVCVALVCAAFVCCVGVCCVGVCYVGVCWVGVCWVGVCVGLVCWVGACVGLVCVCVGVRVCWCACVLVRVCFFLTRLCCWIGPCRAGIDVTMTPNELIWSPTNVSFRHSGKKVKMTWRMRTLGYQHCNEDGLSMLGQSGMNHWVRATQGVDLVGFHCETSHRFFFKNHYQGGIFSWPHCTSFGGAPPFF